MDRSESLQNSAYKLDQQLQLLRSLKDNTALMEKHEMETKLRELMSDYRNALTDIDTLLQGSPPSQTI
ncbi:MAG: hypothetical protein ACOH2R_12855 [Pseudomonas sp.]